MGSIIMDHYIQGTIGELESIVYMPSLYFLSPRIKIGNIVVPVTERFGDLKGTLKSNLVSILVI